jgi:GTPase SAR1 family protein
MTIKEIVEIENDKLKLGMPIKENMNVFIPDIDPNLNIPCRNGFHAVFCGSGGSGKSSLMMNLIKGPYKKKFNNIYYFCPMVSFTSVKNHPFKKHDKVYHDFTIRELSEIYKELEEKKEANEDEYSLIILDDLADCLKNNDIQVLMNKMMIKSRHLQVSWIISLQAYYYFPKQLRRQITNFILFKTKSIDEFQSLARELFNMNSDDALTLYNYVFDANYNHLDVDTVTNTYYKNFNLLELKSK